MGAGVHFYWEEANSGTPASGFNLRFPSPYPPCKPLHREFV